MKRASQVTRKVVLCSPDKVKKVGIVWHENDLKAFQFLQDYFKNKGAIVRNICFSESRLITGSNVFTKKETNWIGFPVGGATIPFMQTEFDLLLNITIRPCFPLEAITGLSVASFKIGWDFNDSGFYDLSIDVSSRPDPVFLAEQQLFYFKTFNQKK